MWPTRDRPESGIFVADQADALRRAGVDLDVFHFRAGSPLRYARAAFDLLRRRRRTGYDVVHAHFGLSAWVALAARARVRAVTFHGTDLAHPRSRRISLAALGFIDLPAAASEELAALVPASRVRRSVAVLPCGVALDRALPAERNSARTKLGIDRDSRVLLLPSDPSRPEKRADRARQLADRTDSQLITLGGVAPQDVADRINASDLVVIPSEREGFGIALLEALACGRPVFSTPNGIAEEALAGIDGTLCAEWDLDAWTEAAIEVLESSPGVDGAERAGRWSTDACANKVISEWEAALSAA